MRPDRLRALVGRRLEAGTRAPLARAAAAVWGLASARAVARPLALPEGVRVIGIGGAVLGGAGKTPLAIALARALAAMGEPVALIGHAYRAAPEQPRVVRIDDDVTKVGDDALTAARALAESNAVVVVAPRRQAAVDHAASLGRRVLVVDGLLQTSPRRLDAAILTVDGSAPWGAGSCPPAGDLRAPIAALRAAADHVAAILPEGVALAPELAGLRAIPIPSRIAGAVDTDGRHRALDDLARLRVGLLVTIARPGRVMAGLAAAGVRLAEVIALGDHAVPAPSDLARAARAGMDAWVTTARCATKLPRRIGDAPVLALDHRLDASELAASVSPGTGTDG
ncbi:Tetraacyldisaccharide 4'-kinase [Minicystis rosea]|nr:Tetraacyldisaccharide 4'-kinase [Minicystis rosea]